VQKELFPLVDVDGYSKPTLQIIVEECLAAGIEEICIVANRANLPVLKAHFSALTERETRAFAGKAWALAQGDMLASLQQRITFVVQEHQEGYGHAVYQAKSWVGGEPFLTLLGDHVYLASGKRCSKQVVDVFEAFDAPVSSVAPTPEANIGRFGTIGGVPISGRPGAIKVTRMVEKPTVDLARAELRDMGLPEGMYQCFFGIHAFPSAIFDCLEYLIDHDIRQRNEIQLTSAQELLLRDVPLYVACMIEGERYDMGVPEGLVETQLALAMHSPYRSNVTKIYDRWAKSGESAPT
jgi:UTP--glucose-1-phosphate uridylyltransferase